LQSNLLLDQWPVTIQTLELAANFPEVQQYAIYLGRNSVTPKPRDFLSRYVYGFEVNHKAFSDKEAAACHGRLSAADL
jgi:hypothetical protein